MDQDEFRSIEEAILNYTGEPELYRLWQLPKETQDKIQDMLLQRCWLINQWFLEHIAPSDFKRLEEVSNQLLNLTQEMYRKAAQTYRTILQHPDVFPPDDMMIEGGLKCKCENEDDLIPDPDLHLGSDLSAKIISIIQQTEEAVGLEYFEDFLEYVDSNHRADMTDEELGFINVLDDGSSWAENWLNIRVCHAVHALCTHQHFSIPDILRMKRFYLKIELERRTTLDL